MYSPRTEKVLESAVEEAENMGQEKAGTLIIGKMLSAMVGFGATCFADRASLYYLKSGLLLLIISCVASRPGLYQGFKRITKRSTAAAVAINVLLFFLCIAYMIYNSYTPFMYQQF